MSLAATAAISSPAAWTPLQRRTVALCTAINALDGMDVLIVSILAPSLAADWKVGLGQLGAIFSAGLFGMMIGCVVIAPLADRIGRRPLVLAGLAVLAAGMLGTGLATGVASFAAWRTVAGIGIGVLLATVAALVGEAAPAGRRSVAIGWFQAGYPIGAVVTGLVAMHAIPAFGWQAVLLGAGAIGAAMLPLVWAWLPESTAYLMARAPLRADPGASPLAGEAVRRVPFALLFAHGRFRATLLLWLATLGGFATLYFVTSWITKLVVMAGLALGDAIWATTAFNLGGFAGGLLMGALAVRYRVGALIAVFLATAAVLMVAFGAGPPLALLLVLAAAIGVTLQGGFTGFYTLAAQLYPAEIRGAGIGWALGIGRGGAIVSPLVGGWLLGTGMPLWAVFACFALPLAASGALAFAAGRRLAPGA